MTFTYDPYDIKNETLLVKIADVKLKIQMSQKIFDYFELCGRGH